LAIAPVAAFVIQRTSPLSGFLLFLILVCLLQEELILFPTILLAFLFPDFVSKLFFSFPHFRLNRPTLENNRKRDGSSHFESCCKVSTAESWYVLLKHNVCWWSFTLHQVTEVSIENNAL
jgi:hypothetical protein